MKKGYSGDAFWTLRHGVDKAIASKNLKQIAELCRQMPKENIVGEIEYRICYNQMDVVNVMLPMVSDLNCGGQFGRPLLHTASFYGRVDLENTWLICVRISTLLTEYS